MFSGGGGGENSPGRFLVVREGDTMEKRNKIYLYLHNAEKDAEKFVKQEHVPYSVFEIILKGTCSPSEIPVDWKLNSR
jgi:hypothetical protein